jgi:hypothetical protein
VVIHDLDDEEEGTGRPASKPGRMTFVGRSQEITNEEKLISGLKDHGSHKGSRRSSESEVGHESRCLPRHPPCVRPSFRG